MANFLTIPTPTQASIDVEIMLRADVNEIAIDRIQAARSGRERPIADNAGFCWLRCVELGGQRSVNRHLFVNGQVIV